MAHDLTRYAGLDQEYADILQKKEAFLVAINDASAVKLIELSNAISEQRADFREVQEAMAIGGALIAKLEEVARSLKNARNWGVWDMLGGGLFTTAIKYENINKSRDEIHAAQELIGRFQRELADVDITFAQVQMDGFTNFADYFFDNLMVDWIVQSRIIESKNQVDQMLVQVNDVIQQLKAELQSAQNQAADLEEQRKTLLETAV